MKTINRVDKDILNKRKIGLLCETKEDCKDLLLQLHKLGYKLTSGNSLVTSDYSCNNNIIYTIYNDKVVCFTKLLEKYDYIFKSNSKQNKSKQLSDYTNDELIEELRTRLNK